MSKNYSTSKNLSAGKNSNYVIKDNDGNTSIIAFDSREEANNHINEMLSLGQDPLKITIDYDAMGKSLNQ